MNHSRLETSLYYRQRNYLQLKPHMLKLQSLLEEDSPDPLSVIRSIDEQLQLHPLPELQAYLQCLQAAFIERTDARKQTSRLIEALKAQLAEKNRALAAIEARARQSPSECIESARSAAEMVENLTSQGVELQLRQLEEYAKNSAGPCQTNGQVLAEKALATLLTLQGSVEELVRHLKTAHMESWEPLREQIALKDSQIEELRLKCGRMQLENRQLESALEASRLNEQQL